MRFPGAPYAALPLGAYRMRPPQPVVPWQGVRDAARTGATVPQGDCPLPLRFLFPSEPAVALCVVDGGDGGGEAEGAQEGAVGASLPGVVEWFGGGFVGGADDLGDLVDAGG
ncbi:carboxylesterase family protein, partial [Streptomyces globisporus]|uniref:carboxylesterase family protein n=1 Tax=Streptomyces globisporus TaxID=1908 RepID=UPI0034609CE8